MNSPTLAKINKAHIEHLFSRLRRHGDKYDDARNPDVCRLFFVDSDVMSVYIDGQVNDIRSAWPSLFSLVEAGRPANAGDADEASTALSNATARSISDFLFGRFREGRNVQSNRLWLTPEHSRELDGIVHAVLASQSAQIPAWQESVEACFLALAEADPADDKLIEDRLQDIFDLLITNAAGGKLARAYDIRRRFTSAPEQAPLFPTLAPGSAFIMRADTPEFQRRTAQIAALLFDEMLTQLKGESKGGNWDAAFSIKSAIFKFHAPNRPMREYVQHVASSPALIALAPERNRDNWLRLRAGIAAREVADVYSLARLCTLAEFLNKRRETNHGPKWEVCIISGAMLLERLVDSLKPHGCGHDVFVLHPLSVMRFDKFLRPDNKPQEPYREGDTLVGGDDFALNAITSAGTSIDGLDVDQFVRSLTRLLTSRSAAFAPLRDRSLHRMHTRLLVSSSFDQDHYLRVVRDVIARGFVQTYIQVNHLARSTTDCLSAINLPWLALPLREGDDSAAERYVQNIHVGQRVAGRVKVSVPDAQISKYFEQIFTDDSTGYTGMLCAALGYLAKGREWLKAAETLANSAVVTAVDAPSSARSVEAYMPEGNESLYLSAFISRMCVSPSVEYRDAARVWRDKHAAQMVAANERRKRWMHDRPSVANVPSSGAPSLPRWRLVEMRYLSESLARQVFCWLIDILAPTENDLLDCDTGDLLFRLGGAIEQVTDHANASSKSDELAFVRAQLMVASIQAWCCARASHTDAEGDTGATKLLAFERHIARTIFVSDVAGSELVVGLRAIFERHSTVPEGRSTSLRQSATPFPYRNFAAIDALRVPFFERLSRLPRGSHFSSALTVHVPIQVEMGK